MGLFLPFVLAVIFAIMSENLCENNYFGEEEKMKDFTDFPYNFP